MTLYKRTLLIVISTLLGLVLILFAASRLILLGSFVELEREAVTRDLERVTADIRAESASLGRTITNWANWDATYAFANRPNPSFLEQELPPQALANLQVDFLAVLDPHGEVLLAHAIEPDILRREWIQQHVVADLLTSEKNMAMVHGLTVIDGQTAMLAASLIHRSSWAGPPAGVLIGGRVLDEASARSMVTASTSTLTLHPIIGKRSTPGFDRILGDLVEGSRLLVEPVNEEMVAGYALMQDIANDPALMLEVRSPRTIYESGRDGLSYYVMSLLLAGLVFALVFLLLLDRSVLSRLERVSTRVKAIGHSSDFSARVELQGKDELAELSSGINSMLDELEKAQKALRTAHDDLERRVEERTEELRQAQQQVIEQERMRALGQMASGIAHDFNNALATILGSCELLMMERADQQAETVIDEKEDDSLLESIHTAARDAANAVSRLREFYRYRDEKEELQNVDLSRVAKQVISMTEPMWKDQAQARGLTIRIDTKFRHLPLVPANEAELREMLTNLIFNAIDAMPEGGTITLATDYDETHVIIEVSDTGLGMSDETRRRCLEPFFTTKGKKGTGLGLAMVHGTVRRHEGQLEIESVQGKGTTMRVIIPIETTRGKADVEEVGIDPLPAMKLLLVDDVPSVRRIVRAYLTADGHSVHEAVNGREGLERFYSDTYDLVITDRGMPEMGGDQLAAEIAQADPSIPILMLTGFGEMMKSAGERPEGVHLVLSKPVTVNKLRRAMRHTIELSRRQDENDSGET